MQLGIEMTHLMLIEEFGLQTLFQDESAWELMNVHLDQNVLQL
jgi:hypothetical protein